MCPDFPKPVAEVDVAAIWAYGTRTLTGLTGQPRTDLMGEDADFEAGTGTRKSYLDAAISTRSSHAAGDVWTVATRELTGFAGTPRTDLLGEDADFEAGVGARKARIDRLDNIPSFETPVEATVTMTGAEDTLVEKTDNKIGLLEGYVDLSNMVAGDTIIIRQKMQVKAAGAYVIYAQETYSGVQTIPLLHITTKTAKDKIIVTAEQTSGTYKDLDVQFYRRLQA